MSDTEPSEFTSSSFLLSALLVFGLLVSGLVIVVSHAFGHHTQLTRTAGARSLAAGQLRSADRVQTGGNPHGCDLPAGSQTVPAFAPEGAWVTVGQLQVPQSPASIGPQRMVDGVGECFAHSPTGGLYAALNFLAANTVMSEGRAAALLAAPSPARSLVIAQDQGAATMIQNGDDANGPLTIAGFQVSDYTPATEDLTVAIEGPQGGYASAQMTEVWQHDDWWTVIPSGGQLSTEQLTSLAGFIPWSAP